jgi:hypothetical protein
MADLEKTRMQNQLHQYSSGYQQYSTSDSLACDDFNTNNAVPNRRFTMFSSAAAALFNKRPSEEDLMTKASMTGEQYKQRLDLSKQLRQTYVHTHLPHLIKVIFSY